MTQGKARLLAAFLVLLAVGTARAADAPAPAKPEAELHPGAAAAQVLPADKTVTTHHVIKIDGRELAYQATAGVLPVAATGNVPEARIFYVSYTLDGADKRDRPLTFAFNGGPGAASAYLHLGALGPRRIVLNPDGTVAAPPARFVDNPLTWLAFTDLVFIDPVGTGFSRSVGGKDEKGAEKKGDKSGDDKAFFATRTDTDTLARVIRLYLTRNDRWLSPKFLVGESYGGFRVAALADRLQSQFGVGLNGAILISPVLDFALIWSNRYSVLPWALKLPTLAAIALDHGKSSLPHPSGPITRSELGEVEAWSLNTYLPDIAQGDALDGAAAQALTDKLAAYTGMPKDFIKRSRARIRNGEFAKMILHGSGKVISFYDGSVTAIDPDPESPVLRGDRTLPQLDSALAPAFNAYLREELKFETDLPYLVLNSEVGRDWHWQANASDQGFVQAIDNLKAGITFNPHLKVLIAHGLFDLVTPYFTSAYAIGQMYLDSAVRKNLELKTYAAGHMIYTHDDTRAALFHDAQAFFRAAAPAGTQ